MHCIMYVAVSLNDVKDIEDPLNKVEAGLVVRDIPLQSVHIKAKLIDLAVQVTLTLIHVYIYLHIYNISLCTGGRVTSL